MSAKEMISSLIAMFPLLDSSVVDSALKNSGNDFESALDKLLTINTEREELLKTLKEAGVTDVPIRAQPPAHVLAKSPVQSPGVPIRLDHGSVSSPPVRSHSPLVTPAVSTQAQPPVMFGNSPDQVSTPSVTLPVQLPTTAEPQSPVEPEAKTETVKPASKSDSLFHLPAQVQSPVPASSPVISRPGAVSAGGEMIALKAAEQRLADDERSLLLKRATFEADRQEFEKARADFSVSQDLFSQEFARLTEMKVHLVERHHILTQQQEEFKLAQERMVSEKLDLKLGASDHQQEKLKLMEELESLRDTLGEKDEAIEQLTEKVKNLERLKDVVADYREEIDRYRRYVETSDNVFGRVLGAIKDGAREIRSANPEITSKPGFSLFTDTDDENDE